jgi:hypothetical protein
MTVISPGCVYCGMFHNPKTCNYQLALLIESYIEKHVGLDPAALADEISKAGYIRAHV